MTALARSLAENPSPRLADPLLLGVAGILTLIGIIMVSSASVDLAAANFDDPNHYVKRHLLALLLAAVATWLAIRVPLRFWVKLGPVWLLAGAMGLVAVIAGLGVEVNGATRWLRFGSFNLQPSEFVKLAVVLFMAWYLARYQESVTISPTRVILPFLPLAGLSYLLLQQPDMGSAVVLMATALAMVFLAGAPLWLFSALLGMLTAVGTFLVMTNKERLERILVFLDPGSERFAAGYQLVEARIAFARGEFWGVGLGDSLQKQFYLPEAHTDFILAVMGEELGLLGTLLVLALFVLLIWRGFRIARRAEIAGPGVVALAQGLTLWLGMQAAINMAVNLGLAPPKGLTLPFVSYGSNSLIGCWFAIGLLYRIAYECEKDREGLWPISR